MAEREPLSNVDTAWLRMDRPTNLMMICGMMMFADRLSLERVKDVVRARMLCFHRFRQRVIEQGGNAIWETDPEFDLDWHVRHMALPHAANGRALEEAVSDLVSTPLDPSRPMWQFHLIDDSAGGSVMVLRIHHCYGDGFALTHVVACMTDADADSPHPPAEDFHANSQRAAWENLLGPVTQAIGGTIRSAQFLYQIGLDWIAHPAQAFNVAMTGAEVASEAASIALMKPDAPTRFKGPLGVMKRAAWAKPLPLFEVKAIAEAFACSVNDVLIACVAGALRSYLLEQGGTLDDGEVRALVPVNLRRPGPVTSLGNDFGLVFLGLPLGVADPFARLAEVKKRMTQLKDSRQPIVSLGILAGMGMVPGAIKEKVLESLAANASAVITNVRGAAEPRYLGGKRITRQIFWVPQSGGIGIGISILSYAGKIDFGLVTDVKRVPDPRAIVDRFVSEFEALLLSALLAPWPGELSANSIEAASESRFSDVPNLLK